MVWIKHLILTLSALFFWSLTLALPSATLAQERVTPRGTLKAVDLWGGAWSATTNYAEGLVTLNKDNNFVPCLAESWKWINERKIEFRLRQGVSFHNGEKFNAEAVKINWEAYKTLKVPYWAFQIIPHETVFEIVDEYTVRFVFPDPDGMAFVKFSAFVQVAPAFFGKHKFNERNWGLLSEPGPWGTGPFKFVEGSTEHGKLSDRVVLEAYDKYWDPRYPKVKTLIFENTLLKDVEEATRLCRDTEGSVDIISFLRPLDTLKVATSPFARVVKSRDSTQTHSGLNLRKKDSKWRDIRLRKALNYTINREELLEYGVKGNAYNLGGHIPPGARGHNPNLTLYTYDTTKAKALLAEAGYPNGFEMLFIAPETQKLEAQVMKTMYERIGLRVKLVVMSYPEWLGKVWAPTDKEAEAQEWDISVCHNIDTFGHTGAAHLTWPYLDASEVRWIEYDPTYEKMWKDMAATLDEAAQDEKMRQLEQYVYDRAYAVFIYSALSLYAVNKAVNFVPQKDMTLRLKETSVADNHWSVRQSAEVTKPTKGQTKQ
jgi:peptide/nickel transport system substrate-binding protein